MSIDGLGYIFYEILKRNDLVMILVYFVGDMVFRLCDGSASCVL